MAYSQMTSRYENRFSISIPGRYRYGRGVARNVELLDLSNSGCRFFERGGRLDVGEKITLRLGKVGPVPAIVRWGKNRYYGVQFDPPLHEAIMDHLRVQFPRVSESDNIGQGQGRSDVSAQLPVDQPLQRGPSGDSFERKFNCKGW